MPGSKSRNKGQRKQNLTKKTTKNLGDITINDFANSSSGSHSRLKKAVANVTSDVKQRLVITEDSLLQNDDLPIPKNDTIVSVSEIKRKSENLEEKENENSMEGIDYPLDLWFLISEHISPEMVGKFSVICKKSYYVTRTAKFWFHLLRRHHKSVTGLPQYLKPGQIIRPFGLRFYVIRALHFSYGKFLKGPDNRSQMEQKDPHSLVKRFCSLMWHKKGENRWYFFFKLKDAKGSKKISHMDRLNNDKNQNFEFSHNDVMFNPEEGCKVLRVTCLQYSMLQPVIGLTLQTVSMNLSPGFEHHRLILGFGSYYVPQTPTQIITLVGVVHVDVFDWWQIQYPYQDYQETKDSKDFELTVSNNNNKTPIYDSWEQIYSGTWDRELLIYA